MNKSDIDEAKRLLPLPALMAKLGDGASAKPSGRCPFHDDQSASFSVFTSESGAPLWKCFSGCGTGDEITYLEKRRGLANGAAIREYLQLAGVVEPPKSKRTDAAFNWPQCVAAFTDADAAKLAEWRGLSVEFVRWLHARGQVGTFNGKVAFPNHGDGGKVVSCHIRLESGKWIFKPQGQRAAPLILGDPVRAGFVLAFESQWDAFAVMDLLGWHVSDGLPDTAVVITRGASNAKLVGRRIGADAICYAFAQNDEAGQGWLSAVANSAGCKVLSVATPAPHKDPNDWKRAEAKKPDIEAAIRAAKPVPDASRESVSSSSPSGFAEVTAWIRGETLRTLADKESLPSVKNSRIGKLVVDALSRVGRFYFHADLRDFDSALFFNACSKRLERIRSDAFSAWLSSWLAINRASGLFKYIVSEVETAALSSEYTTGIVPEAYFAARSGALYLSNGDGQAVQITAGGVQLVDNGTDSVLFAAGRTLQPWSLVEPQDPFEGCSLFRDVHSSATHGGLLLQLWLYSFPTMPRSKPPLGIIGEIGSGKTRTLKGLAEFLGLPFRAAKVEEQLESNFWPSINEGGLLILDNADSKSRWLADSVAAAATDGSSQRRRLYTNSDTVMLRANSWIALTSSNPTFGNDAGLADRLLLVRMERRGDETSDAALTAEILAARDAGLSHMAETLRAALADILPVPGGLNKRHPDFTTFAVRIGRALGREGETIAALRAAEADKAAFCLENDSIACALLVYLKEAGTFTGTAAELVPHLVAVDADLSERLSARRLSKRLTALWPHLQGVLKEATRIPNRKSVDVFTFKASEAAGYAGYEMPFP